MHEGNHRPDLEPVSPQGWTPLTFNDFLPSGVLPSDSPAEANQKLWQSGMPSPVGSIYPITTPRGEKVKVPLPIGTLHPMLTPEGQKIEAQYTMQVPQKLKEHPFLQGLPESAQIQMRLQALTALAAGFPHAKYNWMTGEVPLLNQLRIIPPDEIATANTASHLFPDPWSEQEKNMLSIGIQVKITPDPPSAVRVLHLGKLAGGEKILPGMKNHMGETEAAQEAPEVGLILCESVDHGRPGYKAMTVQPYAIYCNKTLALDPANYNLSVKVPGVENYRISDLPEDTDLSPDTNRILPGEEQFYTDDDNPEPPVKNHTLLAHPVFQTIEVLEGLADLGDYIQRHEAGGELGEVARRIAAGEIKSNADIPEGLKNTLPRDFPCITIDIPRERLPGASVIEWHPLGLQISKADWKGLSDEHLKLAQYREETSALEKGLKISLANKNQKIKDLEFKAFGNEQSPNPDLEELKKDRDAIVARIKRIADLNARGVQN